MKRSPGVTVDPWLLAGKRLNYENYKGLIKAVRLLHENGITHAISTSEHPDRGTPQRGGKASRSSTSGLAAPRGLSTRTSGPT